MKRYNVYEDSDAHESTSGGWVMYSEASERIAALEAQLAAAQEDISGFRNAVKSWEGAPCGGHCQAAPCGTCDGTGWRHGKSHRLETERDEARAEAEALRTLLLDCEMLETSDGKVHLRSNIKASIDAARAGAMPGSAATDG